MSDEISNVEGEMEDINLEKETVIIATNLALSFLPFPFVKKINCMQRDS